MFPNGHHSVTKAPFDPADVVTTEHLDAYMDEGRPMLNTYTRHAKIGEGQHGEVYLCYQVNPRLPQGHPDRRIPVAMKSVRRDNPRAKQFRQLRQQRLPSTGPPHTPVVDRLSTIEAKIRKEIAIMKKCRHLHVVRLCEIIDDRSRDKIYMVMEYLAGGEVKWKNENDEPILTVGQTRRIIRDAVLGLEYLHHQGIIHRDIKPANLLWTEDRRQVKIADFGVSHFSYALRLAAAGEAGEDDPILLDDSDLTRRAGTPSFLAPEVVYEHTSNPASLSISLSPSQSQSDAPSASASLAAGASTQSVPGERPPITKSIDIWALGVTLYCLLFGRTPFVAEAAAAGPGTEWSLYNAVCNREWEVSERMGADRLLSGGRPSLDARNQKGDNGGKGKGRERRVEENSEGALVVGLMERLLRKDVKERITLDQVKRHKWLILDLVDPTQWLLLTQPCGKIAVSQSETTDVISTVHFRWNWNVVSRRISSLFRRSRDHGHSQHHQREREDSGDRGPVRSDPYVKVRRHQSARVDGTSHPYGSSLVSYSASTSKATSRKGKHTAGDREPDTYLLKDASRTAKGAGAFAATSKGQRSKSIEQWPGPGSDSASRSTSAIPEAAFQGRRGSVTLLVGDRNRERGRDGTGRFASVSGQASLGGTVPAGGERPKARFANLFHFNTITNWRPNKFASGSSAAGGASPLDSKPPSSSASTISSVTQRKRLRRSEEGLRTHHYRLHGLGGPSTVRTNVNNASVGDIAMNAPLTVDRRASSWGQGDQPIEFAEVMSLASSYEYHLEREREREASGVSSGPTAIWIDRDRDRDRFAPRTSSRLSTNVALGANGEDENLEEDSEGDGVGDEERRFGPACIDEDSSTIASADGEWHNGLGGSEHHDDDDNDSDDDDEESRGEGDDGENDDESDDDDQEEHAVTFSPRRRPPP
ncbi:hypothetical protein DXG03_009013 [Asterophora parasitica]|uniref:non-specific serine/threonine protein kinase n=1 Tax=Asterophora parasitica TaxID=117018 RepID=A0A9P7GBU5_9AGAR|nr:hypothetical protein DXG03_009013 [Asterophora parasitica]